MLSVALTQHSNRVSTKASSRRRETQFSRAETKTSKRSLQSNRHCRDKMRAQIAANSGRFALNWEISVCAGLRGGAGRTRTSNQTIISCWLAKCLKCRGLCVRALCLRKWPIEFQWNDFGGLVSANKYSVSSHGDHHRQRLCSSVRAIIAQERRVSGTGGTTPPASR